MRRKIVPSPLTADEFEPFGDVIEAADTRTAVTINDGYTERFHDLAHIDTAHGNGRTLVSIFRSTPTPAPVVIGKMERHPLCSQAFVPLMALPYLVVVAPAGRFNPKRVRVFLAAGHQGVNYHRGVWHHFLLALGRRSDFLVIDRGGPGRNLDEVKLSQHDVFEIDLPYLSPRRMEPDLTGQL